VLYIVVLTCFLVVSVCELRTFVMLGLLCTTWGEYVLSAVESA
jgi:hypothetical protein